MDKIERKMEKYRKMFLFQYSVILTLSNENALLFLKKVLKTIIWTIHVQHLVFIQINKELLPLHNTANRTV